MALSWGWTLDRIEDSTLREFSQCYKGHKITEFEQIKRGYEIGRYIASRVLTPNRKGPAPADWWTFTWDAKPKTREQWLKENKHLIETWDKLSKAK